MQRPARQEMLDVVGRFIRQIDDLPGWREWQRKKIRNVLDVEIQSFLPREELPDYEFPAKLEKQHNLIMLYLELNSTLTALNEVEFYFRRYPFRGLPITHHTHLTNICEMYFSRIYETRERFKKFLNALNGMLPSREIQIGKFLKRFDQEFHDELKARNRIHHHEAFEDIEIRYVFLTGILSDADGWSHEQTRAYRYVSKKWAERVRKRSATAEHFLEVVATLTLEHSDELWPTAK